MVRETPRDVEENCSEISDSTVTNSSSCIDLLNKSPGTGASNTRECRKSIHVGPKASLSQYLEMKYMTRNQKKRPTRKSTKKRHFHGKTCLKLSKADLEHRMRGGGDLSHGHITDKVKSHAAAAVREGGLSDPQVFPFKSTPSGNFKLKPSQIVYESKDLSIVAADPASVSLNITESEMVKAEILDKDKKPFVDNWTTTCLYTTVGTADLAYSDFDTSDTDRGNQASELSLAKMGYVTDNCIEWNDHVLPKKSDLKEILLYNILNMINPDIQVKVGSKTYKCHRIVLQSYSSFFTSKSASLVELPESSVPGDVFSLIYRWMLHNTDSYTLLKRDNILHMFKAAQYLGIKELEEQCWSFIDNVDIFCEDKAFLLYLEARGLDNKVVMELMVPRVQRFFLTLVSSKEFVEFHSSEVCMFLQSNYICVHCEEEVFMSGVRWLLHDWPRRKAYAIEIMGCVRFGLIHPKLLLALQRHLSSPEFKPIISIPEVGKMVHDGISIQMLKLCGAKYSSESIESSKQRFDLEDPVPRNWAGTERCYQSYAEFMKDLTLYRTKQRLEVKKSKMKMEMEKVLDKDDFLSSAVLPPESQQMIKRLHQAGLRMDCMPPTKQRQFNYTKYQYNVRESSRNKRNYEPSLKEKDEAARKIQKAYRSYSSKKLSSDVLKEEAARKIQKAYRQYSSRKLSKALHNDIKLSKSLRWQSRSDPSLPSGLIRSSTQFAGKNHKNDLLPLKLEKETVFIFGGKTPMDNDESEYCIFFYHPECNEWRKCGRMPEPRHCHSIAYFQEKIYVAGGKHPSRNEMEPGAISRKVWKYDPQHKTWSRVKDMLHARRSFNIVGCNNKLYVIGGRNEKESAMSKVERFESGTNSWVAVAPMHVARAGAAVSEFKSKIWVAGGLICSQPASTSGETKTIATNSVEYYDWRHDVWVECTGLRYTLAYGVMVPANNRIFVVGGAIGLQNTSLKGSGRQIDVWDQESQKWCMATVMAKPRHAHTAVYLRDTGYMFIMGGLNTQHDCTTDTVECWRVEDGQWITGVAPLPSPISGSAALTLPCKTFC